MAGLENLTAYFWNEIFGHLYIYFFLLTVCVYLLYVCLTDYNYDFNSILFMHTDRGGREKA